MINNGYKVLYIVISVGGSLCEVQTTDQEHSESNTRTLKMSRKCSKEQGRIGSWDKGNRSDRSRIDLIRYRETKRVATGTKMSRYLEYRYRYEEYCVLTVKMVLHYQ